MVIPATNILEAYLRDWFALVYLCQMWEERISCTTDCLLRALLPVHNVGEVRGMCRYFAPCSSNIVGKRKRTNQMSTLSMNPLMIHTSQLTICFNQDCFILPLKGMLSSKHSKIRFDLVYSNIPYNMIIIHHHDAMFGLN